MAELAHIYWFGNRKNGGIKICQVQNIKKTENTSKQSKDIMTRPKYSGCFWPPIITCQSYFCNGSDEYFSSFAL